MNNEKIDQAKGRIEQAAGDLTNNEQLKDQGERHEQVGSIKERISDAAGKLQGALDTVQQKLDEKSK